MTMLAKAKHIFLNVLICLSNAIACLIIKILIICTRLANLSNPKKRFLWKENRFVTHCFVYYELINSLFHFNVLTFLLSKPFRCPNASERSILFD